MIARSSRVALPPRRARTIAPVSASSAKIPPSPRLSARIITARYLPLTTMISDQTNSERMPSTLACVTATGCDPTNVSCSA